MIQRLLILLFLSLFLTACGTTSSDSADNDDNTNLPETQVFDSLSKASKDADAANEEQSHIFNAIGVQAEYRDSTLDISNVSSKLELTFDENGDMSSVKFGNATPYPYESYNINAEYSTPIELDGYLKIGGTDDNPSSSQIIVTRDFNNGSDENDFISEYMVGANWRDTGDTSATSYDRGFLVAGFETTGSAIPTNGTAVEFTGNGEGYYQGDGSYYSVAFDVSATVNFQLYNVALETSNSDGYDITDGSSSSIDHLNFAGILRYNSETNTLTGNDFITTGTDDDIDTLDSNELSGSANARFYGPAAEELGGTFRMSKSTDDYYYGYFGATSASNAVMTPEPAEPVVAHMIETTTMPAASGAPAVNHGGYASLNAALSAAVAGTDVTISMAALAVQSADMYTYTRPDNQTAWDNEHQTGHKTVISKIGAPILSITYKENPEVIDNSDPSNNAPAYNSISSVSPYVSGNRTSTANGEYDFFGHSYYGTIDSAAADKTSFVITSSDISASTDVNTRETQYMIRLTWLEMTASNNIIDDLSTTDNVSTVTAYEEGYLIAGFETTGAELAMVTDTAVSFTGAGAGSYNSPDSPLTDSNGVTFDVSATVDFVSYTVGLTTTNTAGQNCVEGVGSLTCTSVPLSDLNFTSNLTFAASTNVISGNVSADGMSGSVDARFYGLAAEELGGTFRMSKSTDDYYYGYFGATSASNAVMTPEPVIAHTITMPATGIATTGAPPVNDGGHASLDAALAAAVDGTDVTISLNALAVQSADMYTYTRPDNQTAWDDEHQMGQETVLSKIDAPILSITYKRNPAVIDNVDSSNGAPAYNSISSVTPYMGANSYASTSGSVAFGHLYYSPIDSAAAANKTSFVITSSDISASTDVNIRETSYMTLLTWLEVTASNNIIDDLSTTDNVSTVTTYEQGYLVAGIETTGAELAMVTDTAVSFTGAGEGSYNSPNSPLTDTDGVTFDVSATVNFASYTVGLTTTNTAGENEVSCVGEGMDETCTYEDVPLSDLNFTSNLTFAASTNVISGNVSADGMSGSVDARFYGPAAEELGGTFRMSKSTDDYYMGYFGATSASVASAAPVVYNSLSAASADALDNNESIMLELDTLAIAEDYSGVYQRQTKDVSWESSNPTSETITISDVTSPSFSLTFDGAGDIVEASITVNSNTYTITDATNFSSTTLSGNIDGVDSSFESALTVSSNFDNGSVTSKDFIADHMVGIDWHEETNALNDSDETITSTYAYDAGYAVAGFETVGSAIPTTGTAVEFTGNGEGYYQGGEFPDDVTFDITATVDFETYDVALATSNSSTGYLNFKGTLSYTSETNTLSGNNFVTRGYDGNINALDGTELSGSANAKFYGPAAEELGGTFNMQNADNNEYYSGYFGAKR